jgi:hypothetical protein
VSEACPEQFAFDAVRDTFGNSTDVDSCATLTARIDALVEQALDYFQKEDAGIPCRAGCSFCCHLRVMIYPHEAIALFRYLGSRMPQPQADRVRERLFANAAHISQGDDADGVRRQLPCAFLIDGMCSAYEVRPTACSGYHSLSRSSCEQSCNDPEHSAPGIPVLQALEYVRTALDEGMQQALAAAGLSGTRIELQTAVAALIRNPGLIEKWRSGGEWVKTAQRRERG